MYSEGTTPKTMLIAKNYVDIEIGTHCYQAERSAEWDRISAISQYTVRWTIQFQMCNQQTLAGSTPCQAQYEREYW